MNLQNCLIGKDACFESPFGERLITYADYTASGRGVTFIEDYLREILSYYANTHSEDSFTGKTMTSLYNQAIEYIKLNVHAPYFYKVISIGTGATHAIMKLCQILGLYMTPTLNHIFKNQGWRCYANEILNTLSHHQLPVIFVGPYEHHSNYLLWKESLAEVIEIPLNQEGVIDLDSLREELIKVPNRLKLGAFSAASNVTGILTEVDKIAMLMHQYGGYVFFDFAASAPYVDINIYKNEDCYFDAIFISPHKFLGGPGASGLLIFNPTLYNLNLSPTVAGGGTVQFVNSLTYEFSDDIEEREKAGTPGILQTIKSALVFDLKRQIGTDYIEEKETKFITEAIQVLSSEQLIQILGPLKIKRLAILSFNIKGMHHRYVSTLLNDLFGIQSRAGCACAGPYAHQLLGISENDSQEIQRFIHEGHVALKPGFVRVNFHYIISEAEFQFILQAILWIAKHGKTLLALYEVNLWTGAWNYRMQENHPKTMPNHSNSIPQSVLYKKYFNTANQIVSEIQTKELLYRQFTNERYERYRFFDFIYSTPS